METTASTVRTYAVYILRNPVGMIYVGSSRNPKKRLYQHRWVGTHDTNDNCQSKLLWVNGDRYYGRKEITMEIIAEFPHLDQALDHESKTITAISNDPTQTIVNLTLPMTLNEDPNGRSKACTKQWVKLHTERWNKYSREFNKARRSRISEFRAFRKACHRLMGLKW
jgi:hypothetical protein